MTSLGHPVWGCEDFGALCVDQKWSTPCCGRDGPAVQKGGVATLQAGRLRSQLCALVSLSQRPYHQIATYFFQAHVSTYVGQVLVTLRRYPCLIPRVPGPETILRLLKQDLVRLADLVFVEHPGFLGADLPQACTALVNHGRRDLVRHPNGSRPGAFGVFEYVGVEEGAFPEGVAGVFEVRVGLAGEAHQNIRADADAGDGVVGLEDEVEEFLAGVFAAHGAEHVVGPGLHGDVEVGEQRVHGVVHAVEKLVGDGGGFDGADADAVESVDSGESVDDFEDAPVFEVVGADVDAGEDDFFGPPVHEAAGFVEEIFEVPGAGAASSPAKSMVKSSRSMRSRTMRAWSFLPAFT